MLTPTQILSNLKATKKGINTVLKSVEVTVADRKRAELRVGLNADGGNISPEYSEPYELYKKKLNTYQAQSGTPDLYVSGAFAKSIFATRKGWDYFFVLKSPPPYADKIEKVYNEPSGVSPQGEEDLNNKLNNNIAEMHESIWH